MTGQQAEALFTDITTFEGIREANKKLHEFHSVNPPTDASMYLCTTCWKEGYHPARTIFYCDRCGDGTCGFPKDCITKHKCKDV